MSPYELNGPWTGAALNDLAQPKRVAALPLKSRIFLALCTASIAIGTIWAAVRT
jgi:hypothetical protein